jgi:hypothetical protein
MSKITKSGRTPAKSKFPHCIRCDKPVDSLIILPKSNELATVIVEFECHGEKVGQEIPSTILDTRHGLASYTAFNDFTSALILHNGFEFGAKIRRRAASV